MTTTTAALIDAFQRIQQIVKRCLDGLDETTLTYRVDEESNTIAWLVWHLSRVQDDHVSELSDTNQAWIEDGWQKRFGLPFDPSATGYGQSAAEVAAVAGVSASDLGGYHDAVCARTVAYLQSLESLGDEEFDRVVDTSWDPPVTLSGRLVSVIADDLQHAGQASFIRGVALRR